MKKRGPDEISSSAPNGHYNSRNNGSILLSVYPNQSISSMPAADNDAKKLKLDQSPCTLLQLTGAVVPPPQPVNNGLPTVAPLICSSPVNTLQATGPLSNFNNSQAVRSSRVVHLRNLPSDLTNTDLINVCSSFGKINNYLLLNTKGQAFIEFEDENSASLFVSVSQTCPISLKGRIVFCQFSTHQELRTDNNNNIANKHQQHQPMFNTGLNIPCLPNGTESSGVYVTQTQQQPNAVLRIIIENMLYPVTLDILYQIFSRFGKVLRIITFTKHSTFQTLLQFSESGASQLAKTALDGQNVYNGCCTLRIEYSKLSTLNVKYNNEKSRDYTNPNLASGELLENALGLNLAQYLGNASNALSALQQSTNHFSSVPFTNATAFTAPSALPQAAAFQAAAAASAAGGFSLPAFSLAAAAATNNALANVAGLRLSAAQLSALSLSPVVLVSNLHEQKVTPDALFTLFGVYGDVQRVKILFNKKDNALIQYAEPAQAQLAIQHLDKIKLWGKTIKVSASKHMNVQMPKEGQPQDAGLTKDYSQSSLHRFKKPGSKNYMNIYPPSATLHLSNIPAGTSEEFLMNAFSDAGFTVKAFKFFPKDHKMALMQMESVDDALLALMAMHNFRLAENAHLRVSFSKSGV